MVSKNLVIHGNFDALQKSFELASKFYNLDMVRWENFMSSAKDVMLLVVNDGGAMEMLEQMNNILADDLRSYVSIDDSVNHSWVDVHEDRAKRDAKLTRQYFKFV